MRFLKQHRAQVVVTCGLLAGELLSAAVPEARFLAIPLGIITNMVWVWWVH